MVTYGRDWTASFQSSTVSQILWLFPDVERSSSCAFSESHVPFFLIEIIKENHCWIGYFHLPSGQAFPYTISASMKTLNLWIGSLRIPCSLLSPTQSATLSKQGRLSYFVRACHMIWHCGLVFKMVAAAFNQVRSRPNLIT